MAINVCDTYSSENNKKKSKKIHMETELRLRSGLTVILCASDGHIFVCILTLLLYAWETSKGTVQTVVPKSMHSPYYYYCSVPPSK